MSKKIAFSIVLKDKNSLKDISVGDEFDPAVTIDGTLGEIEEMSMLEGVVLQIKGRKGVLDIGITMKDLEKLMSKEDKGR